MFPRRPDDARGAGRVGQGELNLPLTGGPSQCTWWAGLWWPSLHIGFTFFKSQLGRVYIPLVGSDIHLLLFFRGDKGSGVDPTDSSPLRLSGGRSGTGLREEPTDRRRIVVAAV